MTASSQPPARHPWIVLPPDLVSDPAPIPECPPGWVVAPPDFVGVGMQKSGTSWWYRQLVAHPEIHARAFKELHFFEHHWNDGDDAGLPALYARYFCRPPGQLVGEWTPRYAMDPWAPAMLARVAPRARLLVLLRDPIDRFVSGLSHYRSTRDTHNTGRDVHPRVLIEAVERGRYARHLERLLHHFPREQILMLQYERCVAEPEAELARTYRFLGVTDTGFVSAEPREVVGARPDKTMLSRGMRDRLHDEYDDDVRRLVAAWPEVDPALWPNFADRPA